MVAHATELELDEFLGSGATVTDGARLLERASELIDSVVRTPYSLDDAGVPEDTTVAGALRDAVCAQVEQWLEVGEDNDIDGRAGTQISVTGFTGRRAPVLAPRAIRILTAGGLIGAPQVVGTCVW